VFAYPADGRAYLNTFASLGQAAKLMATLITQKKPVALTGAEGGGDRDYNNHKHHRVKASRLISANTSADLG
jgi:hypothetical protein